MGPPGAVNDQRNAAARTNDGGRLSCSGTRLSGAQRSTERPLFGLGN